jgi:hypothetical protein
MSCRSRPLPPIDELFSRHVLVERNPTLLTEPRVQWALRNRKHNGLAEAVYESRGGELLVHESAFLRWFLNLDGRAKPRAPRRKNRRSSEREEGQQLLL